MEGINVNTCNHVMCNCAAAKNVDNKEKCVMPACVDITDKYSQDEIVDILKTVGTYHKPLYPCKYSVEMYENGAMVINNTNMTNDTTEISQKGAVHHCGSWHNEEIAQEGTFVHIVEDAKTRMAE